jgi:lipopolysaccharide transport system permease protein
MITLIRNLVRHRELLFNLTLRDIKSRYAQSFLGIAWAIVQPLSMVLIFSMVALFVKIPTDGLPRPIFYFAAVLPWTFFSAALNQSIPSIVTNSNLVRKIYFPREIFPMSAILACLFDLGISTVIFAGFFVYYKVKVTAWVLLFPVLLAVQTVLMLAIALLGAGLNVYFRDIRTALPLVLQLWMYASPVIYSLNEVRNANIAEVWKKLYELNPMAGLIDGFRNVLLKGQPPDFHALAISLVASLILLQICYRLFKRLESKFADVI